MAVDREVASFLAINFFYHKLRKLSQIIYWDVFFPLIVCFMAVDSEVASFLPMTFLFYQENHPALRAPLQRGIIMAFYKRYFILLFFGKKFYLAMTVRKYFVELLAGIPRSSGLTRLW